MVIAEGAFFKGRVEMTGSEDDRQEAGAGHKPAAAAAANPVAEAAAATDRQCRTEPKPAARPGGAPRKIVRSAAMRIGVPSELKDHEYRVGDDRRPRVHTLWKKRGHEVVVRDRQAGESAAGSPTRNTEAAGGRHPGHGADEVWAAAEMIIKVKEPIEPEYGLHARGAGALHLSPPGAPLPVLTGVLLQERKVTGIAYETITDSRSAGCRC